jgi:hypothetical protein
MLLLKYPTFPRIYDPSRALLNNTTMRFTSLTKPVLDFSSTTRLKKKRKWSDSLASGIVDSPIFFPRKRHPIRVLWVIRTTAAQESEQARRPVTMITCKSQYPLHHLEIDQRLRVDKHRSHVDYWISNTSERIEHLTAVSCVSA